ncbi:MAG TPA: ThuA domain-containing protein, partial [Pirellulaceae bacterium]|nr:ThuA domain-containing protein [Pirellulaceae bacterium]
GKIYRTRLAKTWHGYVARNELIACLGMLAIDLTPTPAGGLVVTCHSGGPDWGTGPRGAGSLFQIRPTTERRAPQPVVCWPTSPTELRIAIDGPLDPAAFGAKQGGERLGSAKIDSEKLGAKSDALKLSAAIEFGRHVSPGDRFESIRPGYEVIRRQLNAVREQLVVHSTQLSADRRTIIVTTAPHLAATRHAVTLEGLRRDGVKSDENSAASAAVKTEARTAAKQEAKPDAKVAASKPVAPIGQHATVDLGYDLTGVVATWTPTGGEPLEIWLPHLDLSVSRAWTTGSAAHDAFWRDLDQRAGRLVLKTLIDVRDVLRPAVQEGATIDFTLPPERVTLQVAATGPLTGSIAGQALAAGWTPAVQTASPDKATANDRREQMALVAIPEKYATPARVPVELSIEVAAGKSAQTSLALFTNEDERRRAVPVRRLLVPWAAKLPDEPIDGGLVSGGLGSGGRAGGGPSSGASVGAGGGAFNAGALPRPELDGGSWSRGRQLFMADQPGCVKCHAVDGQGGVVGPALGNLRQRDVASVLRDIRQPSYSIHPEYLASTVELKSGKLLTGTVRPSGTRFEIADNQGKVTAVERDEIESIEPSPKSIMPDNLLQNLSDSQVKDLLTFLLTDGPRMPRDGPPQRPAPRKRAEVAAVLADSAPADSPEWKKELDAPPLEVVLVAGPKDHGPGEHDYPAWLQAWSELLRAAPRTNVSVASPWPSAEQKERGQVFVFYQQGTWSADRAKDVDGWLARGAGLVYIHYAVDGGSDAAGMADRIGWAWRGGQSKFRHGPLDVAFSTDPHPITRHFTRVHWHDESYWNLVGASRGARLLGTGVEDGAAQPLFWSREQGRGRVFVSIPGHYSWSFDDPLFRILLLRG